MGDIVDVIAEDHATFRTDFAALARLRGTADSTALDAAWARLARRLETHARAEEDLLYPALLQSAKDAGDESEEALRDHNAIRDLVAASGSAPTGTEEWWDTVEACRVCNEEHLAEEETYILPDARESVDSVKMLALGEKWDQYMHQHSDPGPPRPVDPEGFVDAHTSGPPR